MMLPSVFQQTLLLEISFIYSWLECHAPLECHYEKQLFVIIMTEPKETLSELQDQLKTTVYGPH